MDVGVKTLDPVGDELYWPAQQFRQRIGGHLVGVDVNLDAERAADVLADDPDLRLLETEMQRRQVLHHMRRLGALIDRQPRFRSVQSATPNAAPASRRCAARRQIRLDHASESAKA